MGCDGEVIDMSAGTPALVVGKLPDLVDQTKRAVVTPSLGELGVTKPPSFGSLVGHSSSSGLRRHEEGRDATHASLPEQVGDGAHMARDWQAPKRDMEDLVNAPSLLVQEAYSGWH